MDDRTGIERVLGAVIVALRRVLDWTQEDLAERSGLSAGSISNYEQGEVVPPPDALRSIAKAFNLAPADLDRLAAELLRAFQTMDPFSCPAEQADLASALTTELAEDFRVRALPEVQAFIGSSRERPASIEEARQEARSLWTCLELVGLHRLPSFAAARPELLNVAVRELLSGKSAEAAADDAGRALELAQLSRWVAERMPHDVR
jgi:transcriptional regulator with XRE-family HTH domain